MEYAHARLGSAVRTPFPAPGVTPKIVDKIDLYEAAAGAGIDIPKFREIRAAGELDANDPETADWLLKPSCRYVLGPDGVATFLSMSGGSKAVAGDLRQAAEKMFEAGFRVMHQEAVPGPFEELVSAAVCIGRDGEIVDAYTARKHCEYPEPFGDGLIVELTPDPGIVDRSVELLRSLGYWGIADVEFKRDPRDGRFKLLDINPRVWLWHRLGADAGGTELAKAAYRLALSPRYPPRSSLPSAGAGGRDSRGFRRAVRPPFSRGLIAPTITDGSCRSA